MHIEVVYALPDNQHLAHLEMPESATVGDALDAVARLSPFSELDLVDGVYGVFGRPAARKAQLRAGDRVEIYRPLQVDPKQARRQRAGRLSA